MSISDWPATSPRRPPGAQAEEFPSYLKLDVADFVPGTTRGRLFRSCWGVEPGLPVAVEDPTAKLDLRGRRHVTPEELALDHTWIAVVPVEQPGGVLLREGDGRAQYTANYLGMLDACGDELGEAVRVLAHQVAERGSVIGCSIGRDRTGVLIALVLRGIGIDAAAVQDGEARMRERLAELVEISPHAFDGMSRAQVAGRLRAAHESIGDVLAHCEDVHGGVRGYLAAHGVGPEIWDRLSAALRA